MEIVRRYLSGESQGAIAKDDGRDRSAIRRALERNRISVRDKRVEQSKAGKITGAWGIESGHLEEMRNLPQTKKAQRKSGEKYGPIQGKRNVESGHLASVASKGGKISGKQNVDTGRIWKALEASRRRTKNTGPELRVFSVLDSLGISYQKHVVIGGFQSDVVVSIGSSKISINVDGNCYDHPASCYEQKCYIRERSLQAHPDRPEHDRRRDEAIEAAGYEVVIVPCHYPEIVLARLVSRLTDSLA